jgi:hypothetical protein
MTAIFDHKKLRAVTGEILRFEDQKYKLESRPDLAIMIEKQI